MSPGGAVEEIRSRLDIVEVIGGYLRLSRAGREWKGLCPFHTEHTPSFYVSPEKRVWNCHGCHESGDLFSFVEMIEHTDFRGALELLARRAGVDLEAERAPSPRERARRRQREEILRLNRLAARYYHHVLQETGAGEQGRQFLERRQVTEQDRLDFQLGYAPQGTTGDNLVRYLRRQGASDQDLLAAGLARPERQSLIDFFRHRVVVPIRDEQGREVGFGGRALGEAGPKYLNTRRTAVFDKSAVLFGLDRAREAVHRQHQAVLMEGYFDVVGAHRAGVGNAVSTSGTALTEAQVRLLRRFADEIVLCFDGDAAGRRAAQLAVGLVAGAGTGCRLLTLPAGEDPDDLARRDPAELRRLVEQAPPAWEVLVDQALEGPPGEEQEALRRAMRVLTRIPEASIRALYAERAGRHLGVPASRILEDVEHLGSGRGGGGEARGLSAGLTGQAGMGASAHLLGLLWHRPRMIAEVRDRYQLRRDDFADPQQGALYQELVERAPDRPQPEELPRELRGQLEQLLRAEFPELREDASEPRLREALAQSVSRTKIESLQERARALSQSLLELGHHRDGEGPQLLAELDRVRKQIEALKGATAREA